MVTRAELNRYHLRVCYKYCQQKLPNRLCYRYTNAQYIPFTFNALLGRVSQRVSITAPPFSIYILYHIIEDMSTVL